MKSENKEVSIEILDRLADYGVFISNNAPPLNRQTALVILGEAMLTCFFKEFSGLWGELFPNCRLQDFEASEGEKKKIIGRQDNNDLRRREMQTEAGIEYWDMIKPRGKTVKAGYQLISDLWKNGRVVYLPGKKKSINYKYQNKQQLLPKYTSHYQFPKQLKSYSYDNTKLPFLHKSFGKLAKSTRNLSPVVKIPQLYQRQTGSKFFELGTGSYKSLESYLTDYKEVVKNEI